jgi:hypothetical protein
MIRTEIDITNPQKVEVIETGEIGYVSCYDLDDDEQPFRVLRKDGEEIDWYKPEELRPLEDDRLVFDVDSTELIPNGVNRCWFSLVMYNYKNYNFKVIATPKEKSLEDMTKEELIEIVKQLKK